MTEFDRSDEKMRDLGLQSQCGELMLSCACVYKHLQGMACIQT